MASIVILGRLQVDLCQKSADFSPISPLRLLSCSSWLEKFPAESSQRELKNVSNAYDIALDDLTLVSGVISGHFYRYFGPNSLVSTHCVKYQYFGYLENFDQNGDRNDLRPR